MKKLLAIAFCVAFMLSAASCNRIAQGSTPTLVEIDGDRYIPSAVPEETIGTPLLRNGFTNLTGLKSFDIDLNGDGKLEHISFEPVLNQKGDPEYTNLIIKSDHGSTTSTKWLDCSDPFAVFAGDIGADGLVELFVSSDFAYLDHYYATWVFRYVDNELIAAEFAPKPVRWDDSVYPTLYGVITNIENGIITISDVVYVLGSWGCSTQFRIQEGSFILERVPGSVWSCDSSDFTAEDWERRAGITIAQFPVMLDGEDEFSTLPVGTRFVLVDTDGETYFHFLTDKGIKGTMYVTWDESRYGFLVGDMIEYELFDNLRYPG